MGTKCWLGQFRPKPTFSPQDFFDVFKNLTSSENQCVIFLKKSLSKLKKINFTNIFKIIFYAKLNFAKFSNSQN